MCITRRIFSTTVTRAHSHVGRLARLFVLLLANNIFLHVGLGTRVGPGVASRADETLQAHPWGVDRAVSGEEEHVV
jgi:hypothetical protein